MNIYDYVTKRVVEKPLDGSFASRYAPNTMSDVSQVCHEMCILCINQWFRTFGKGGSSRFLMISGPSGVGKSTVARLAARENGLHPTEIPCSTVKTKKELEFYLRSVTPHHACIVDELDEIDAQVMTDIRDFAKKATNVPIVLICTKHAYGKPVDLVRHSELVQMRRAPRPKLVEWTEGLVRKEKLTHVDPVAIVDQARGDLRQILNALELNRHASAALHAAPLASRKDPAVDAINAVEMLMCSSQPLPLPLACRLVTLDPNIVTTMMSENYLDVASRDSMEGVARAADAFSAADVVDSKIYANQCWELWDAWIFFGGVYPAFQVRRASTHDIRFTKLWSRLSNMYLRKGYLAQLKQSTSRSWDTDTLYATSTCMSKTLQAGGAPKMVAEYGKMVPYDLSSFLVRLTMRSDLKQAAINKIKAAYKEAFLS